MKAIAPMIIHCTCASNFAVWRTPRVAEYRLSRPIEHSAMIVRISGQSTAARNRRQRETPTVARGSIMPFIARRLS
jgi:hypothetical protein